MSVMEARGCIEGGGINI